MFNCLGSTFCDRIAPSKAAWKLDTSSNTLKLLRWLVIPRILLGITSLSFWFPSFFSFLPLFLSFSPFLFSFLKKGRRGNGNEEKSIFLLPISAETFDEWETNGLNKHEKFFVALAYSSAKLEDMRYHVCKMCDAEYFSTDVMSDFCDTCASKYNDC